MDLINIKKRPGFYSDRSIPKQYRTKSKDYTHNAFHADRGHLAPDASFDWSRDSLHSVYSMANIIPQYKVINRRTWIKAERRERYLAKQYKVVNVVNGVVYGPNPKRIGKIGLAYPVAFWKRIYNKDIDECYYYKNDKIKSSRGDTLESHRVNCKFLK